MNKFPQLVKNEYILNIPVKDFLSDDQIKEIKKDLDIWKTINHEKGFTKEIMDLFWILCEYDYAHGPGSWDYPLDPQTYHIADWAYWFKEKDPLEIEKIIKMFNDNGKFSVCHFGIVSSYLHNFRDRFYGKLY